MIREGFRITIVDDEQSFGLLLSRILLDEGYRVRSFVSPVEALRRLDDAAPDLIISDLKMPDMDGIEFMRQARELLPEVDFIMITAFSTVETAVAAMKLGAVDYVTKPLRDPEELRQLVRRVWEKRTIQSENQALREELIGDLPPPETIFAGIDAVREAVRAVSATDATVLLLGETGTGKSLIAKVIHQSSGRRGPCVTINCAAIPENLLESELFGHEKGAFTGAVQTKKGKFELAQAGTVFLDEIGEMSQALQAKLLRVLQERCFERVGSTETIGTDARIITATNRDLKSLVADKQFREDLYYRLNVFPIRIPPLRERLSSISALARFLLHRLSARMGKTVTSFDEDSLARMSAYAWPGNIREMENVIERALILSRGDRLALPPFEEAVPGVIEGDMRSIEKRAIEAALGRSGGNRKSAAEALGISLRSLQYKIKDYGIRL